MNDGERLSAEAQHTLKAASVAGAEFSAAAVADAIATDTATIERQCERLVQLQQFVKRLGVEEWRRYACGAVRLSARALSRRALRPTHCQTAAAAPSADR